MSDGGKFFMDESWQATDGVLEYPLLPELAEGKQLTWTMLCFVKGYGPRRMNIRCTGGEPGQSLQFQKLGLWDRLRWAWMRLCSQPIPQVSVEI